MHLTFDSIGISDVNETFFKYLNRANLQNLSLENNIITNMNLTVLQLLTSLQELTLRGNWIKEITGNETLNSLRKLDLSSNHLTTVNFCFTNGSSYFPNLNNLLLVNNRIGTIFENLICLKRLQHLDLSNNSIKTLDMPSLSNLTSLKTLKLSSNWIKDVTIGKLPDKLQSIDFQRNEIAVFPPELCNISSNNIFPALRALNFSRNYIQKIMISRWKCLTGLQSLDFSKNDVSELKNNTFINLTNLTHLYLDNMIPWLKKIEIAAFNSTSLQNLSIRFNRIDFRKTDAVHIFKLCPNVKWLDISYNFFTNMTESRIVTILSPLTKLEILKAQHISLRKMPSEIIRHFEHLRYLDINRNLLSVIQFPEYFKNDSLRLSIRYISAAEGDINTIHEYSFPSSIRNSLKELDISDNEFSCGCDMLWFRDNINSSGFVENIKLLHWPEKYKCRSPQKLSDKSFKDYEPVDECEHMSPIIVAIIAAGCSLFVFSILFATGFWNRWYIQYYWYKISRRRRDCRAVDSETTPLVDKIQFDGYVVYNNEDGSFVHHTFRSFMEDQLGYKLHIWKRNATNGALVDVILDAIYASRNVIVVVSDNLMKDQWCKFQVDVAVDRSIELGRNCVLFVVLEDVKFKLISESWCVLLTKKPTAYWSNSEVANDIKKRYFEEIIKKQFGKSLRELQQNGE
nr:Toll-like receptor [Ruditapes philippinarum]